MPARQKKRFAFASDRGPVRRDGASARAVILVVGEVGPWCHSVTDLAPDASIAFATFSEICADLIAELQPDLVLSPLFCAAFDCLDLAQTLQNIGYRGQLRVVTRDLPNPTVISSEMKSLCPLIDFAFIGPGGANDNRLH